MATLREAFEAFGRRDDHGGFLGEGYTVVKPGDDPVHAFLQDHMDPDHPATQHLIIETAQRQP